MVFDFIFFFIDLLSGECKKKAKKKKHKKTKAIGKGKGEQTHAGQSKTKGGKSIHKNLRKSIYLQ